jgi:hypothetical protein
MNFKPRNVHHEMQIQEPGTAYPRYSLRQTMSLAKAGLCAFIYPHDPMVDLLTQNLER